MTGVGVIGVNLKPILTRLIPTFKAIYLVANAVRVTDKVSRISYLHDQLGGRGSNGLRKDS